MRTSSCYSRTTKAVELLAQRISQLLKATILQLTLAELLGRPGKSRLGV